MSATPPFLRPEARVSVRGGIPRSYGRPIAQVLSVGPVCTKVRLLCDHTVRSVPHRHLQEWMPAPETPLVLVGCGGKKLDRGTLAEDMYVGSYHVACRRAAAAITTPERIRILSARYGLLRLRQFVEPYDVRMGDCDAISPADFTASARKHHDDIAQEVVVLAGQQYVALARTVWPHAQAPLEGLGGIGLHLQRLAEITRRGAIA